MTRKKDLDDRVQAKNQLIRGGGYWKTICEVFRMLYDEIHNMTDLEKKNKMVELMVDGIIMGNKMYKRLDYYKRKYKDTTGSQGKNLITLRGFSKIRKMRRVRVI